MCNAGQFGLKNVDTELSCFQCFLYYLMVRSQLSQLLIFFSELLQCRPGTGHELVHSVEVTLQFGHLLQVLLLKLRNDGCCLVFNLLDLLLPVTWAYFLPEALWLSVRAGIRGWGGALLEAQPCLLQFHKCIRVQYFQTFTSLCLLLQPAPASLKLPCHFLVLGLQLLVLRLQHLCVLQCTLMFVPHLPSDSVLDPLDCFNTHNQRCIRVLCILRRHPRVGGASQGRPLQVPHHLVGGRGTCKWDGKSTCVAVLVGEL
mmetsp:Transcript_53800/g.95862  ORF Transcript_53800/g.95862 Transcript_53800/m.95862 type:complete len:258 (-) Transcript_53800:3652-4425(-)